MQPVTSAWLRERADLHDARVREVRTVGSSLEITIDDEWASLRGLSKPEGLKAHGVLVVDEYVAIEGEPRHANGGWISEVTLRGDELVLVFCDKPPLSVRAASVWWRSAA